MNAMLARFYGSEIPLNRPGSDNSLIPEFRYPFYQSLAGEVADEFAAVAGFAADFKVAIVVDQHVFDDGQSQAGATGVFMPARVGAVEALGQAGNVNRVDADTAVFDGQMGAVAIGRPGYSHFAFRRRVLHGVEHQVGEGTAQLAFIATQQPVVGNIHGNAVLFAAAQGLGVVTDLVQQGIHVGKGVIYRVFTGFNTRQQDQVGNQGFHPGGLGGHGVNGPAPLGWQFVGMVNEGFQVAADYRERGPHFMGNVAHEVPAHLFQLVQPGNVLGHDQAVVVAEQADLDLQVEMGLGRGVQFQRFPVVPGVEVGLEGRVSDQVVDVLAPVGTAPEPQQVFGRAVPPFHGAPGVGHDHTVAHGIGGFLNPVDAGPEAVLCTQVALVQLVQAIKDAAPHADTLGRFFAGVRVAQPLVQAAGLDQGPPEVTHQANQQAVYRFTKIQANQRGAGQDGQDQAQIS